jgi:tRNA pseudouridine38-40 synthase
VDIHKIAALVEYDGTAFIGYQRQAGGRTVQAEIEGAVTKLAGVATRIHAASRTDTGVHALGQIISFWIRNNLSPEVVVRALNHFLPDDVALKGACVIDRDFDVRRRAVLRSYRYRIACRATPSPMDERYCLVVRAALNVSAMREAARALQGTHDFGAFATSLEDSESTVRTVREARVVENGDRIEFLITANAFLRHQVRNTVGQLVKVGLEKCAVQGFAELVDEPRHGLAGPAAPSRGLCLERVRYERELPFAA